MLRSTVALGVLAIVHLGCGGTSSAPPPKPAAALVEAAPVTAPEPVAAPTPEEARSLPDACVDGPMCTFPSEFAERLCSSAHPEVALHLFAPKTPWKRAYLQRSFQAWHVGGRGELRELRSGEEVIIVSAPKGQSGGMQIGGQGFDVLRWDGTCVSLMEDELSFRKPPAAVPANIPFKKLDRSFQTAFSQEKQIEMLRASEQRTCEAPGAEKEPGKSKCELARRQLSLAIAQVVAKGKALPELSYVP
ncbi:MAG: hypothetical protein IPM79_33925 [Polyangiaceae bacterium]|jgi:hypothetical protein|nr:hypothetical protein [Polyangiaceae bacterium]MBK8942464.1 hypothetical protein [Polyangiaceae bacterium]